MTDSLREYAKVWPDAGQPDSYGVSIFGWVLPWGQFLFLSLPFLPFLHLFTHKHININIYIFRLSLWPAAILLLQVCVGRFIFVYFPINIVSQTCVTVPYKICNMEIIVKLSVNYMYEFLFCLWQRGGENSKSLIDFLRCLKSEYEWVNYRGQRK